MKKKLFLILKIAASIGIYIFIFTKIPIAQLREILKATNPSYLIAAVATYFAIQFLSAYRWYVLCRPLGLNISPGKTARFYFLGMFFNLLLPSAIGGDFARIYYLNKEAGSLSGATASVFLDRDLGLAALLAIALLASFINWTTFNGVPLGPIFVTVAIAFSAANLALFYRPTYNLLHRLLSLVKLKSADERVERMFSSMNCYRGQSSVLASAIITSVVIQMGCVFVNMLSGSAIGLTTHGGIVDYLVFIPAISLISMSPLSINGLGWREAAYIILFKSVGATEAQAVALAVLWFAIQVITSLPGGIIYILNGTRKKEMVAALDAAELETSSHGAA